MPVAEKTDLKRQLSQLLTHLLLRDFSGLIQLLYRVDVPEEKLKLALKEKTVEDAGSLLADLILQRQAGKNAARNAHRFPSDASDEERWQ